MRRRLSRSYSSRVRLAQSIQFALVEETIAYRSEQSQGFSQRYALVHVSTGGKVYLRRGGVNQPLIDRYGYKELTYKGFYWPGRVQTDRLGRQGWPVLPAKDPQAFAEDVRRARVEDVRGARAGDPPLTHLPDLGGN